MLTAMVSGYYDGSGNDLYVPPGADSYGDYCYSVQDMCNQMACAYHAPPGSVRMLSNGNSGPMVPLQVPPGHLIHQVLDENGTVRHILIPPPMPMPVGAHYSPSHASTTLATPTPYYPYPQPAPYAAPPHFHPQPPSHLQPPLNHQTMHGMMQQCNGHAPQQQPQNEASPPPTNQPIPTQKDDRYQRQTYKFRRKLESRSKDCKMVILPSQASNVASKKERRKLKEKQDELRINGSSGSQASEDDEATWLLSEFLSNMRPPTVAEVSARSVTVCWKPPEIPASDVEKKLGFNTQQSEILYEVLLSEKKKEGLYETVYSGYDHHCTINTLKPSTEYSLCIRASIDDVRGNSVRGSSFKTQSTEMEAPQPPRLAVRTKNSLTLKWNNSGDGSARVKSFILEYDEGFGGNFIVIYSGPLKQYKVTKLSPATCYKFRLATVTEKGKSPYSLSYSSPYSSVSCFYTCGNAPSQPLPPVLKQAFLNKLHLEWEKRANDDDFTLQIEDEHVQHGFLTAYTGRDTSFVCSRLKGNTEYKFRLCAMNEEGSGPWSKVVTYFTLPDKLSCPGKPIPKGRIHASCFRVMWDPPKDNKQSSITKYILEVDKGFGFESVYTGPETEFFLENLLPGSMYKLRVACISSAGHSPYSEVNSITTAAVSPGKCATPKLQSKPEASFLCLEWAHPEYDGGSAISEYEVDMTSPDNVTLQAYKGSETSCIVNDLLPGRPYLFQVRAYNRVGAGPWSDPLEVVSGAGPPDAPRNVTVFCNLASNCMLSWEEPVNNGATITSYQVQMNSEESSDDEENFREIYEGLCCSYEVQNLCPATQYYFRIKAVNDAGPGAHSEVVSCKTFASVPGAISSVNVSSTSTSLYLSWKEPSKNGSDITSYNVELDDYLYNTEGNVPELCIEDLSPETVYGLRVQAINEMGDGPFSEPIETATLKSPPNPPELECVAIGHNFLRLRWGSGKNPESIYYTLEISHRNKNFVPIYHGTGLSHKVNRLQENTAYQFRICASSESGQGPYSELCTFQTSRAPPPSLKAPKVCNITEETCLVEWTGAKQMPGQTYSYQLQLISDWGLNTKTVYQGPDTKFILTELEPHTTYSVRVAVIRHHQDEDLTGIFSPTTAFTTLNVNNVSSTLASSLVSTHQSMSASERRTLKDRHLSFILVVAFTILSFLLAAVLEHSLGLNDVV